MTFIELGEDYMSRPHRYRDDLAYICWRTREILGAYMLEGVDIQSEEDIEAGIDGGPNPHEADDGSEDSHRLVLYETHDVKINERQRVKLSNRPFLLRADGTLFPYTQPGYVALHIEPVDSPRSVLPPDPTVCDQVIFRLSHGNKEEEAAIFHGFSLDESFRIDKTPEEAEAIFNVVGDLGLIYFEMMTQDQGFYEDTHLSQTPEESIDTVLNSLLGSL